MRHYRIYQNQPLQVGDLVELDSQGAHHLGTVLRGKPGDAVTLFNGQGGEFYGELVESSRKRVTVKLTDKHDQNRQSPLRTHLGQAISRGDRFEYALQKAVELGVSEITPLHSNRGEVHLSGQRLEKRLQQWQKIILSACEQCGLNRPPQLNRPMPFSQWCAQTREELNVLLHPGETTVKGLFEHHKPGSVALGIGPEGGFDSEECHLAREHGWLELAIGPRTLRTETAPIVALSIMQLHWGDF